jgi:hypothetical protein
MLIVLCIKRSHLKKSKLQLRITNYMFIFFTITNCKRTCLDGSGVRLNFKFPLPFFMLGVRNPHDLKIVPSYEIVEISSVVVMKSTFCC